MEPIDASWLAAVVDSEGSIYFHYSTHRNMQITVAVSNINLPFMEKVSSLMSASSRIQTNFHKYKYKAKTQHRGVYELKLQSMAAVQEVLQKIYPYMIIKRKQAELVFEYLGWHTFRAHEKSEDLENFVARMKALNSKDDNFYEG